MRCSGKQRDKADDVVALFIGTVDKLHAIAARTAMRDANREIEADALKGDVDRSRGIDGERFGHLKLHAFRAYFSATAELRGILERQTDWQVDGKSRSAIVEFPHGYPISTDHSSAVRWHTLTSNYRHIG